MIPDVLQRQSGFIKLLIPPRSVSSFPIHLHPPIPKRHQGTGGAGGAPKAPSPKDSIVFSKVQLPHLPCSAWHPLRETALDLLQWEPLTPSSLLGVPTSSAAHQPGLSTWDCCRRSHGQRSLIHGAWPGSPGSHIPHISPKTALPCHGDGALGPSAGKVLAGCHSPVQKHRRLASECWSMSNLPRRAKSQDTDLQILL